MMLVLTSCRLKRNVFSRGLSYPIWNYYQYYRKSGSVWFIHVIRASLLVLFTFYACIKPAYTTQHRNDFVNINPSLTAVPEKVCWIWTAKRDVVLRKLYYTIGYHYGLTLQIARNTPHLYLCILLAGDVATNPGPNFTSM